MGSCAKDFFFEKRDLYHQYIIVEYMKLWFKIKKFRLENLNFEKSRLNIE